MSRSLRTRPTTLYAQDSHHNPVITPVPSASSQTYQSNASYSHQDSSSSASYSQGNNNDLRSSSSSGGNTRRVLNKSRNKASQVGSNLKKRLSMRYAEPTQLDAGGFSTIPSVPSLPPMPAIHIDDRPHHQVDSRYLAPINESSHDAYDPDDNELQAMRKSSETSRSRTDMFETDPAVDLELLSQSDFDPQTYLRAKLSHHTESSLRGFKSSLNAAKQAANDDLKRQVFKNYSEFITISKEIATLENDMLELKELLSEWKQLPQALELDDSSSASSLSDSFSRVKPSGKPNRNSTIDLQQIYRAQITSLWEGIEGSQKFLPYIPGRHLIAEASSFTELNAATYKPQQSVALFLLDDLLLIATRRKRQMSSKVRLVAERCFSLAEIVVIDLKDGGDLTNAIKIKRASETHVYRTDRTQDKRALLNAFRRVAEELAKKRRNESESDTAQALKRNSTLLSSPPIAHHSFDSHSLDGSSASVSRGYDGALLTSIGEDAPTDGHGGVMAAAAATAASERKDPGRWNNDFADQLSVCIALREWDQAVTLIEKGRAVLSTYTSPTTDAASLDLSNKLTQRTAELVNAVSSDFVRQHLKKSSVTRNASYLLRLDQGEKARQLFLDARTELLKKRTRQIKFEGDTGLYISELGMVHFTLIKNTSEWYMSAFKDGRMASGFVQWAWERAEEFGQLFRRQVYGVGEEQQGETLVKEVKEISLRLAGQLKEVGLDFSFLLEQLLEPEPAMVSVEQVQGTALASETEGSEGNQDVQRGGAAVLIPKLVLTRSSRIGLEGEQIKRERERKRGEVTSAQELRRQSVMHLS
ncbi:related to EXO84 - exocyst protein essential for secretion [Melanopsichium pennsylvanicum]|uniref:Exocyst complex component EXO84 n=2 Tax=Melanopsichium pennsylvanicum TaxID=63383 RepID=A0AAJ4XPB8_9BASI|nr:related to EXO84-exocyst protein essential for secretion [Melanopsichium pennsylvanicum 4]SNX86315.1 related to EXO84 - exocyst protein essential for secretion [Melanopsichium pennsylvanicum]